MQSPAKIHTALLAAIERVARHAGAAQGKWHAVDGFAFGLGMSVWSHVALHDPASILARTTRDRERAERHRPIKWLDGDPEAQWRLRCAVRNDWPCPDYRDLMHDYGIEVP